MTFFRTLNYSSCNEDGHTELAALNISPKDTVACITGSGDRVLHMLMGNPKSVHAFDANPIQNYLLELKMAAVRQLDYKNYVDFLGLFPFDGDRFEIFISLQKDLTENARSYFYNNEKMIRSGILYAGRWEKYFRFSAFNMRLIRAKKIKRLFSFEDIVEQRRFLHTEWNTWAWKALLYISFCKPAFRFIFGDPGFYTNVNSGLSPGLYIHDRMTNFLENHLARSSFMLALVFQGRFFSEDHFPPYLQQSNFLTIKNRLDKVVIHHRKLLEMIDSEEGLQCNKFSLSDVSSFLSQEEYLELFKKLATHQKIRFCLRDFLTNRGSPDFKGNNLRFLKDLQENLAAQDTSFGYTFIIGEN